jgi:hypothetical protein
VPTAPGTLAATISTSANVVDPNHDAPSFTIRAAKRVLPGVEGAVSGTSKVIVPPCAIDAALGKKRRASVADFA